ncbi:hypothetical protein BC941DRAFT_474637 [Chlamydoabsidia padenii]|nr:hypothetical protein BC941DRAFT_474637 [Chlamydoabsidia padenii]
MKFLSFSLMPLGCIFLAHLTCAQPASNDFTGETKASSGNLILIHYKGKIDWEAKKMEDCIPVVRKSEQLDGMFFPRNTRCYVYTDKHCSHRVPGDPFDYKPGYYLPVVNKGFGRCHVMGQ